MKITAWRITQTKYATNAFSGLGAWLEGARWNPKGTYMVYATGSVSLAAFVVLVNLHRSDKLFDLYVPNSIEFDSKQVLVLEENELPPDWNSYPPGEATQKIGEKWLKSNRSVVLRVPSVVIPEGHNYLINPMHKDFKTLIIGTARRFVFDRRLNKE